MRVLTSSPRTFWSFKVVAAGSLLMQLYGLKSLLLEEGELSLSLIKSFVYASLALGVCGLFFYVRKSFPQGSRERAILLPIAAGVGILVVDELGKINPMYAPIRIIAKIAASSLFAVAMILGPWKPLPSENGSLVEPVTPLKGKGGNAWFWVLGFLLAFAVGFAPMFNTSVLNSRVYPFERWMHIVWFSGLISIAFVISVLRPERVWRWGIAVGLGLPVALMVRFWLDLNYGVPYRVNLYVLFVSALATVFCGLLPAFCGVASGFLMRKSYDIWKEDRARKKVPS